MNPFYSRRNINIGIILFFALLLFFGWHTFINIQKARKETRTVNATLQSLRLLGNIMDDMQDIETGNRGFLISGDKEFLNPYYAALSKLKQDTVSFKDLFSMYPERAYAFRQILLLVKQKAELTNSYVNRMNEENRDSLYQQVKSGRGNRLMVNIRKIIFSFENEDWHVLQQANKQRQVAAANTAKFFGVSASLLLITLFVLFGRLKKDSALREENENRLSHLASLVEQASDAIFSIGKDFTILSWNKGAENMYGYSRSEALGKDLRSFLQSRQTAEVSKKITEALQHNGFYQGEFEYRNKKGEKMIVQGFVTALDNQTYDDADYVVLHRDITGQKKLEEHLQLFNQELEHQVKIKTAAITKTQEKYFSLINAVDGIVWEADANTFEFSFVSQQAERLLGYPVEQWINDTKFWSEHIHPDDRNWAVNYCIQSTKEKKPHEFEYRMIANDGRVVWLRDIVTVVVENDQPFQLRGIMIDITERKKIEQAIKYSEETRSLIMNSALDAIIVMDAGGFITAWNPQAEKTFGWEEDEIIGKKLSDTIIPSQYREQHQKGLENYLRTGKGPVLNKIIEITAVNREEKEFPVELSIISVKQAGEDFFCGFLRDISERKKVEEEIVKINARFQMVSKATSDIVWEWNVEDDSLWWNDNYYSNLGYHKQKEFVHINDWYNKIHPDDIKRVKGHLEEIFKNNGSGWKDSYRFRRSDGTYLHFFDRGFIMRDKNGKAYRMIGSMVDMTPVYSAQRELKESEGRLRTIINSEPQCIKLLDKNGLLLDMNPAGLAMIQADSLDQVVGQQVLDIVNQEYRTAFRQLIRDVFKGKSGTLLFSITGLKGMQRWLETYAVPMKDADGIITALLGVTRDVTDTRKAEEQLRQSEEKYRTLVEQAADAIALYDANGKIMDVNTGSVHLLGYKKEELVKMFLSDILTDEETEINPVRFDVLQSGESTVKQRSMRKKDGTVVQTEVRSQQLPDGRFLSVIRDLTERIKTEEELNQSYEAIRRLTDHIQNIREEERTHIAREIHDELGQQLTVMKMDVSWLNKKLVAADGTIREKMKDLLMVLDATVKSVRRISSELRPSLLDDLGLTAAMEWQLMEFEKRSAVKTRLDAPATETELSNSVKTALFRIFQESLTNVARHSGAKKLAVSLRHKNNNFVLSIIDDGKGFDKQKIAAKRTLGILGMKERTSMIGGIYEIVSKPGKGTAVIVTIPLNVVSLVE